MVVVAIVLVNVAVLMAVIYVLALTFAPVMYAPTAIFPELVIVPVSDNIVPAVAPPPFEINPVVLLNVFVALPVTR